jgi:CheY-like chemotaxis protein
MKTRPILLLVEEDLFAAELLVELLQEHYILSHVTDGQDALQLMTTVLPAALLLNPGSVSFSGLALCQSVRANPRTAHLPVIFLTDNASNEELFRIYEVGGDDYLPRSLTTIELRSRINHTLTQCVERRRLQTDLSNAFSVAMTAMSSAAEVGEILQFLRASFHCADYWSICKDVLKTLTSFGLDARVQIRGQQQTVSYAELGPCSVVEESIFSTMSKEGRLVSFSTHIACTYEHITLIVKNMPREDTDRYGRMSDNIALLCEAVNERVAALDNEIKITQQKEAFATLVAAVSVALGDIQQQYCAQQVQLVSLLENSPDQTLALQQLLSESTLDAKLSALVQHVDQHNSR